MPENVVGRVKNCGPLQFTIEWEIPDFMSLENSWYESPISYFGNTSWYIRVYPKYTERSSSEGFITLCLYRLDSGTSLIVHCELSLKMIGSMKILDSYEKCTFTGKSQESGLSRFVKRSELFDRKAEFLPSGTLTVLCGLMFPAERVVTVSTAFTQTEDKCGVKRKNAATYTLNKKFARDYENLLFKGEHHDVTLQVSGQEFKAHRLILAARSPVFAAMLRHEMNEKNSGLINIEDCDLEHFPALLSFMYNGSVDCITSQNMCSLYKAAEKYDIEDLKSECLTTIKTNLTVESFCDIYSLAYLHTEEDLIKQATDFFVKNMSSIIVTDKWLVFLRENTAEGNGLIIKALETDKSSSA